MIVFKKCTHEAAHKAAGHYTVGNWSSDNEDAESFEMFVWQAWLKAIHPEIDPDWRNLNASEKRQQYYEEMFRVLEKAGKESRGQPPRVDRFRDVARLVEQFEAQGVPFGVSPTSRMNKLVRNALNEKAATSNDPRKSRRKQITAAAVRKWLRDFRKLRFVENLRKMYPYTD
jgi:hypothetical protein